MSKIQEALDKIRADSGGNLVSENKSEQTRSSLDSGKIGSPQEDRISLMSEVKLRSDAELAALRLIHSGMRDKRVLNAYRELRTSILRSSTHQQAIVMVTSWLANSGSSYIAMNLGAAFALDEAKTALVIDCNLNDPVLHKYAVDSAALGLSDYLKNPEIEVQDIIHPTGIERLRVIPAGTRTGNGGEYFTSTRLQMLFDELKARYPERHMVVDSPPLSLSADPRILSDVCDHAILTVPYGRNTESQIVEAARAIGKDKLLGVVLNNEPQ